MDVLIKEFYVSLGNVQSFLEAEKYRLEFAAQFPHMLPPDMDNFLIEEVIPAFEKALREPVDVRLSMVPFAAFALNASYTLSLNEGCYKIEVHAPEYNAGLVETIKGMLGNHGFEEIEKK